MLEARLSLAVSAGYSYAAVVLLALWLPWRRSPAVVAAAASVLILYGLRSPPPGGFPWMILGSRALSLFVIWATAFLGTRYKEKSRRLDEELRAHTRELSEANQALRQREAFLARLIDVANSVIVAVDPEGRVLEWNHQAELLYGASKEALMQLGGFEALDSSYSPGEARVEVDRLLAGGAPSPPFESTIRRPDGEERVLLWSGVGVRDRDGVMLGVLASGVDITDFKRMDRERDERLRFEELIGDLSARLADPTVTDPDEAIHDGLRGLGELMGADRVGIGFFEEENGALIGAHLWKSPELDGPRDPLPDRQPMLDKLRWLAETLQRGEDLVVTPTGGLPEEAVFERQVRDRVGGGSAAFVPMIVGGKVIGGLSLVLVEGRERAWPKIIMKRLRLVASIIGGDLVRRRTEEQLRQATAETQAILDTTTDGVVTMRPDGTVESFSRAAERIFGYSADEIVGRNISMLRVPEDRARFVEGDGRKLAAHTITLGSQGDVLRQRKDGSIVPVRLSLGEIDVGGQRRYTGFVRDLSQEKAMEQRLRAAASEAALAEQRERRVLASDLHDGLGQLLSLANMKLGALRNEVETRELRSRVREVEEVIGEADRRTTSLTYQLSPPVLDDVGLVAAAEWIAEDLERRYGLRVSLTHDGQPVTLDEAGRVTLFRALRELLINVAKHADVDAARVDISSGEGLVQVRVEDAGCGFDPTEENGGFGVLSLRDRLEHLGGKLEVDSEPGRGTRITAAVQQLRPNP
jgi:PAS domain S-box-containing protein